jgi:hypothetical protein
MILYVFILSIIHQKVSFGWAIPVFTLQLNHRPILKRIVHPFILIFFS